MRRPIGVTFVTTADHARTVVICDDGTVWSWMDGHNRWTQMESVPGTPDTDEVFESEIVNFGELDVLTPKELEVLALLGQGLRLKEIAAVLHRSPKTIDNHRTSIGRKLKLADRVDLAQVAAEAGLQVRDAQRKRISPVDTPSTL